MSENRHSGVHTFKHSGVQAFALEDWLSTVDYCDLMVAADDRHVARCRRARSLWERFRGLMLAPPLQPGEALWLPACGAVQTAFLCGPIDLLFLQGDTIRRVCRGVRPWRVAACRGADSVIELPAGEVGRLALVPGLRLVSRPVDDKATSPGDWRPMTDAASTSR